MRRLPVLASCFLLLATLVLPAVGRAQGAIIKDNHLKYNGKNYFRAGSEDILIGSYGEKKSPLTQANYLEVQDGIPTPKLKVRQAVIVDIDFKQSSKKDIEANVNKSVVFKGSVETAYEDLKAGKLKLVKFIIENEDIKDAINSSPKVIENLKAYGNDSRVCHQVFVVLEATIAESVTSSTKFDVSGTDGSIRIGVSGGTSKNNTSVITLSKGSTFAYGIVKLDWDANQKSNWKKVVKATDDQWSMN